MSQTREFDGVTFYTQSILTTSATTSSIIQVSTSSDKAYQVTARCIGKQTDGTDVSSYYELTTFKNDSGTLTEIGTADNYSHEDNTSTNFVVTTVGTVITFDVTGIAAENYLWNITAEIIEI